MRPAGTQAPPAPAAVCVARTLSCAYACRPAASYLAAPTHRRWRGCPSCRGAVSLWPPLCEEMMTAAESTELAQRYDPRDAQEKGQARGAKLAPFRAGEAPADPREHFY